MNIKPNMANVDWYNIIYPLGASGSFFMYFISKHENFLHYDIKYLSENYIDEFGQAGEVPIDAVAIHDNLQYKGTGECPDIKKNTIWWYREISFLAFIEQFRYSSGNKIIIIPSPHQPSRQQFSFTELPLELLQQQKHIIFNSTDWTWVNNRNKKHMTEFTIISEEDQVQWAKHWTSDNLKLGNFYKQHNCKYVYINPYKLLTLDDNEYNKLLTFIEEKPLTNWKETITEYVTTINLEL